MLNPSPGSAFSSSSVTFNWSAGSATSYRLGLGDHVGATNYYDSHAITPTSTTALNIPNDGRTIYARLFSLIGNQWQYVDYTYQALLQQPAITSVQRRSDGHFIINGIGAVNFTYTLKWAPNLSSPAQKLNTVKADSHGIIHYDDNASGFLSRFYWITSP